MGRGRIVSRRGGLQAPKRQIANGVFEGFGVVTMGAAVLGSASGTIGAIVQEAAMTLVRTRGRLMVSVRAVGAQPNHISGAFGLYVTTAEAFAVGITALKTPLDDGATMWFVWEPFSFAITNATITQESNRGIVQMAIDSRGQRKLKASDVMVAVVEVRQETATTGTIVDFTYQFRQQFKL